MTSPSVPLADRFWAKVEKTDDCWWWKGSGAKRGGKRYGNLKYRGKEYGAHQVAWLLTHGPIPEGMCVLHTCDNKLCVRPDHLFLGTKGDNSKDMVSKGRSRMQAQPETILRGSQQTQAKLTENQVEEIRRLLETDRYTKEEIAGMYNVSGGLIGHIAHGRNWTHVKKEI